MYKKYSGVIIPMMVTPFTKEGKIDVEVTKRTIRKYSIENP